MQYKYSINLDRILNDNGFSETRLKAETGISHHFLVNLMQHRPIKALENLIKIVNILNKNGIEVKPEDLISFEPIGTTKIKTLASQYQGNDFLIFFRFDFKGESYKDLAVFSIEQHDTNITIKVDARSSRIQFNKTMQRVLFADSFALGHGVAKLMTIPEGDKKTAAQLLCKQLIPLAMKAGVVRSNVHTNKVEFHYFDTFVMTFHNMQFKDKTVIFTKDRADYVKPVACATDDQGRKIPKRQAALATKYPFQGPHDVGITK